MNTIKISLFVCIVLAGLFACGSEDDDFFQIKYSSNDLVKLHGDDTKHWIVEGYYSNYNQKTLQEKNACFIDDTYMFQKGSNEITVIPGEVSCDQNYPEDEVIAASYTFYEEDGVVFISIGQSVVVNDIVKNTFFSLQLVELSDSHMIFASGEKGNYMKAIVFVAI